jgi:hypothetical protein
MKRLLHFEGWLSVLGGSLKETGSKRTNPAVATSNEVGFHVFTAVTLKNTVFWDVTP